MIADCETCDRKQVPCKSCQESQRAICYRCDGDIDDPYCEAADPTQPDYVEILRLHRKYRESDSEPLWRVFVRVGQRLEKAKPDRCKMCFRTQLEYSRLVDANCSDTFHALGQQTRITT